MDFSRSSVAQGYGVVPKLRPSWLALGEGLELFGFKDTAARRRQFIERLKKRAAEDEGRVAEACACLQSALQRGWYWGSQEFRKKMLKLVPVAPNNRNYRTSGLDRQKERQEAKFWIDQARNHFGVGGAKHCRCTQGCETGGSMSCTIESTSPKAGSPRS